MLGEPDVMISLSRLSTILGTMIDSPMNKKEVMIYPPEAIRERKYTKSGILNLDAL